MKSVNSALQLILMLVLSGFALAQEPIEYSVVAKKRTPTFLPNYAERDLQSAQFRRGNLPVDEYYKKVIQRLDRVITKHKEYSDAYVTRAIFLLGLHDSSANLKAIDDLESALKYCAPSSSKRSGLHIVGIVSYKAKAHLLLGQFVSAIDDLEYALRLSPDYPSSVFRTYGANPDSAKPTDLWKRTDLDTLVSLLPLNAKAYIARAYYFSSFAKDHDKHCEGVSADLKKATDLDSSSPLPYYLIARMFDETKCFDKLINFERSQPNGETEHHAIIDLQSEAIAREPKLKQAYLARAEAYSALGENGKAIDDYTRVIEIDNENATVYGKRAECYSKTDQHYLAVEDYKRLLQLDPEYFSAWSIHDQLAKNYCELANYPSAVREYGLAIHTLLNSDIIELSFEQLRLLYPEFDNLTDKAFLKRSWDSFGRKWKYKQFADALSKKSAINREAGYLPYLYVARGDAFLSALKFRKAVAEYNRAKTAFPDFRASVQRWRLLPSQFDGKYYLDINDIEFRADSINCWTKVDYDSPINERTVSRVTYWSIHCSSKIVRQNRVLDYDEKGTLVSSWDGASWERIVPDTFGDFLVGGWCGTSK